MLDNGADGTLRKEIADANASPGADTIIFKIPAAALPGTIIVGAAGEIPITDTLTIKGPGVDLISVSGSDVRRIFNIDDGTAALRSATISGLTLTDGMSATSGGAIFSAEPLTLRNVVIRSSSAGTTGGGVATETDGKVLIVGSRIVHNTAANWGGGLDVSAQSGVSIIRSTIANNSGGSYAGLYAEANGARAVILVDSCIIANNIAAGSVGGMGFDNADDGKVIVRNSLITGNKSSGTAGGVYFDGGNLFVTNTTFSNNTANYGGALASGAATSITISGSRFLGNKATAVQGGGALYLGDGVIKMTGSLFSGNASNGDGGAIAGIGVLTMSIAGSNFQGNSAAFGGGAFAMGDGAVLNLKSSTLSGNIAGDGGGAIFGFNGSILNLTANKFTENRAGTSGGALYLIANPTATTANLLGNLFQANVADSFGGAIRAVDDCVFTSKADRFIGNAALAGQGGGVHLANTGGIAITGSLFQSNVAGSSGGGLGIAANATLTGIRVLGNVAGSGGRGGGLRVSGTVLISKSLITGNVANDGGGLFADPGTLLVGTTIMGNVASFNTNSNI